MGFKTNSSMNLSVVVAVLLAAVMVRQSVVVESGAQESLIQANEFTKCKSELGVTCGGVIHQYLFKGGKEVSKNCCNRLLAIGEDCHDLLTKVSLIYERVPVKQAKEIRRKNDQVWAHCERIGVSPTPKGYSDMLKKCSEALGDDCGESIYGNIFGVEKKVSGKCCKQLIPAGEDCNDFLTRVTIVYERLTEKQAKEAWQKKDKVWSQCKKN